MYILLKRTDNIFNSASGLQFQRHVALKYAGERLWGLSKDLSCITPIDFSYSNEKLVNVFVLQMKFHLKSGRDIIPWASFLN